jgi:hypothetical protein
MRTEVEARRRIYKLLHSQYLVGLAPDNDKEGRVNLAVYCLNLAILDEL